MDLPADFDQQIEKIYFPENFEPDSYSESEDLEEDEL